MSTNFVLCKKYSYIIPNIFCGAIELLHNIVELIRARFNEKVIDSFDYEDVEHKSSCTCTL